MRKDDINMAVMDRLYGTNLLDESEYECPFCHGAFTGRPVYCPTCNRRLIKKGTSNQFIEGIEEHEKGEQKCQ